MATKNLTIRLSKENQDTILKIAETLDCTYLGKGSISRLLKAIGNNEIILVKNFSKNT